jgi:hypothetical protein
VPRRPLDHDPGQVEFINRLLTWSSVAASVGRSLAPLRGLHSPAECRGFRLLINMSPGVSRAPNPTDISTVTNTGRHPRVTGTRSLSGQADPIPIQFERPYTLFRGAQTVEPGAVYLLPPRVQGGQLRVRVSSSSELVALPEKVGSPEWHFSERPTPM